MSNAIDGFVIRRIFQPVTDLLAPHISAFNIARFFCDGILVYVAAVVAHGFYVKCPLDVIVRSITVGIGILVYRLILWLVEIEWKYHSRHQGRRFFLGMRLLALAGLVLFVVRLNTSGIICVSLLVCSAYFSSCALRQTA